MNHRDDSDTRRSREAADAQGKGALATAGKVVRAVTAVALFGIPLITGTAALIGYGAYKAYKRVTKKP